eukprot:644118-Rhodomonas_salina.1
MDRLGNVQQLMLASGLPRRRVWRTQERGLRWLLVEGLASELMSGTILSSSKQLNSYPEEGQQDGLNVAQTG